jgi:hypothetical protein
VLRTSKKTQYYELVTKIYVNMLVASIIEIRHSSEIMVWVEVTQIWMLLGKIARVDSRNRKVHLIN